MKTKFNKILGLMMLGLVSLTSCDSFLDMQDTEQMTFEKIWEKKSYVEGYFIKCFNFMPDLYNPPGYLDNGASDEAQCGWATSQYAFKFHNNGSWNVSDPSGDNLTSMYNGIRHCTVFLQNVDRCLENKVFDITEQEVTAWKAEARFARAYYYYCLIVRFGPIPLWYETLADPNQSMEELALPRQPLTACIEYVMKEMNECSATMADRYEIGANIGRPTKSIVKAITARLALYAARPLFNVGGGYMPPMPYSTMSQYPNGTGEKLFPAEYDGAKWEEAARLNKEAIDFAEAAGHALYIYKRGAGETAMDSTAVVYRSLYGVINDKWNSEIIWGRHQGRGQWTVHIKPRGMPTSGLSYGGYGPTQRHVDRYANSGGMYGIIGYGAGGTPTIDPNAGYSEEGFTSFANPANKKANTVKSVTDNATYAAGNARSTYNMYVNREPRFYMNVMWNASCWPQSPYPVCYFHSGIEGVGKDDAASGPPSHDHPWSGYMVVKGLDRSGAVNKDAPTTLAWPYIRLAELYLNYAEALNEYDPGHADVLKYLNKVRNRAGIPSIGSDTEKEVYANVIGVKDKQREMILREREVEFAFEQQRYNDERMLLQATETNNGPTYGMNKMATNSNESGEFWKRTNIGTRIFLPKHYLFPFRQNLMDRNENLTQNYGW